MLRSIESELRLHTRVEEEIFYPAFKEAARTEDDSQLYYQAVEQHNVVDHVLPEGLEAEPGSDVFAAKVTVLKGLVEHHAREEERGTFPRARKGARPDPARGAGRADRAPQARVEGPGRRRRRAVTGAGG